MDTNRDPAGEPTWPDRTFYSVKENEAIRRVILQLLVKNRWSQEELGKRTGIPQQRLSGILRRAVGVTPPTVRALALYMEKPETELFGLGGETPGAKLQDLPEWASCVADAMAKSPAPDYVYDLVGTWPASILPRPDPIALGHLAQGWWTAATKEERAEAQRAFVKAKAAARLAAREAQTYDDGNTGITRVEPADPERRPSGQHPAHTIPARPTDDTSQPRRLGRPKKWADRG